MRMRPGGIRNANPGDIRAQFLAGHGTGGGALHLDATRCGNLAIPREPLVDRPRGDTKMARKLTLTAEFAASSLKRLTRRAMNSFHP